MPSDPPPPAPHPADGEERLHPSTLLFAAGGVARQMVVPALVGGVGLGGGWTDRAFAIGLLIVAVTSLLGAAARYARFRYRLAGDGLVVRSGVLARSHRVIPLGRVQNVELRQSALHRVFGVAELRVETAGGGGEPEAVLSVLGEDEARALRAEVLIRRRAAAPAAEPEPGAQADAPPAVTGRTLVRLTRTDLLLAGATANEAGVIAAGLWGVFQLADEASLPVFEQLGDPLDWIARVVGTGSVPFVVAAVVLGFVFVFVGWAFSMAGALVRYYGFTLARDGGELRKRYGLLTVREASVPLERVQALRVKESLLRRALGLATVKIETAGGPPGEGVQDEAEAFVPILYRADLARLVRGIFDDLDLDRVGLRPVDPRSRRRALLRYALLLGVPALVFAGAAVRFGEPALLLALLPVAPLPWLLARWQYLHRGYALVPGYVVARAGVVNRVTWIIPEHKLQTVHVTETPFQRRHGLASVVVDTAAGGRPAVVIDLGDEGARALLDELTQRARTAARALALRRRAWGAG
jgi:putative membrane protein